MSQTELNWDGDIPLTQILTHVRPAYGGETWEEAFACLHANSGDAEIIANLSASAQATRTATGEVSFREPICVSAYDLDTDDDPDPFGRTYVLANGMHRVATAHMLGLETVLCASDYDRVAYTEYVTVHYRLPGDWSPDGEDQMDFVIEWLRSFPLPDGTWVETDLIASRNNVLEGMWVCPHTHVGMFAEELRRRYPSIDILDIETTTSTILDAEWDAEYGENDPFKS